jgi:hypothetical protein
MTRNELKAFEVKSYGTSPEIIGWYWCINNKASGPFETEEEALFERGVMLDGPAPELTELKAEEYHYLTQWVCRLKGGQDGIQ